MKFMKLANGLFHKFHMKFIDLLQKVGWELLYPVNPNFALAGQGENEFIHD